MRQCTLCLLVKENRILLGMKKEGFGKGNFNGFGGKPKGKEFLEEAAIRELLEEVGLTTTLDDLTKKGELIFTFPHKPDWDQVVHVYMVNDWKGDPRETKEMKPEWFSLGEVPYSKMWKADTYWIPHVLEGKYVTASFTYNENREVINHKLDFS